MLNKIFVLSLSVFALSSKLLAAPSGPFIGGIIGATSIRGEHTYNVNDKPATNKIKKIAPHGGISAGYLMSMKERWKSMHWWRDLCSCRWTNP